MKQQFLESAAAFAVMHNVFYKEPTSDYLEKIRDTDMLGMWPLFGEGESIVQALGYIQNSLEVDADEFIKRDYFQLFEMPGNTKAYPWGSVYTDKDNLLMAESTREFSEFCQESGVVFDLHCHQPVDHIGLMLACASQFFKEGDSSKLKVLFEQHLMPWCFRFTELAKEHSLTGYYFGFSLLLEQMISYWARNLSAEKISKMIYV